MNSIRDDSAEFGRLLFHSALALAKINIRDWLMWYLTSCAENGGRVPLDIDPFLPWMMSVEKHRELTVDPNDSS